MSTAGGATGWQPPFAERRWNGRPSQADLPPGTLAAIGEDRRVMTTASLGTVAHPIPAIFGDVFLRPGVAAHLLTLEMTIAGGWLPPGSIAPVILEGFMWSGPGMAPVAPIGARVVTLRDFPVPAPLQVTLTDDQLIAFECARGDSDVELTLDLSATVLALPGGVEPSVTSQTRYRIPAHRWLEQLDKKCRRASRPRVGTRRMRGPRRRCGWCVRCVPRSAPSTGRSRGSRPSWVTGRSRCGCGCVRPTSTTVTPRG